MLQNVCLTLTSTFVKKNDIFATCVHIKVIITIYFSCILAASIALIIGLAILVAVAVGGGGFIYLYMRR